MDECKPLPVSFVADFDRGSDPYSPKLAPYTVLPSKWGSVTRVTRMRRGPPDSLAVRAVAAPTLSPRRGLPAATTQGLTLVHFSAQHEPFLTLNTPHPPIITPDTPLHTP